MTTPTPSIRRRFLFLDPDLTGLPADAAGKPDGYTRMGADGTIYTVTNGSYDAVSGGGGGGGGGNPASMGIFGNCLFIMGPPMPVEQAEEMGLVSGQQWVDRMDPQLAIYNLYLPGGNTPPPPDGGDVPVWLGPEYLLTGGGGGGEVAESVIVHYGPPDPAVTRGEARYWLNISDPSLPVYTFSPDPFGGGGGWSIGPSEARNGVYTLEVYSSQAILLDDYDLYEVASTDATTVDLSIQQGVERVSQEYPRICQIDRVGTAPVTITPATGVTINGSNAVRTLGAQYSTVTLRQMGGVQNNYVMHGDFT